MGKNNSVSRQLYQIKRGKRSASRSLPPREPPTVQLCAHLGPSNEVKGAAKDNSDGEAGSGPIDLIDDSDDEGVAVSSQTTPIQIVNVKEKLVLTRDEKLQYASLMVEPQAVAYESHSISKENMQRFNKDGGKLSWLSDENINMYTALLQARDKPRVLYQSSFFAAHLFLDKRKLGLDQVKRWCSLRKMQERGLTYLTDGIEMVVVPCNLGNYHWTCAAIDLKHRALLYFDSSSASAVPGLLHALASWVESEAALIDRRSTPKKKWMASKWRHVINPTGNPRQGNYWDCGVFTLCCADALGQAKDGIIRFRHSQKSVSEYFRAKIALQCYRIEL